jgi:hypothetical protein
MLEYIGMGFQTEKLAASNREEAGPSTVATGETGTRDDSRESRRIAMPEHGTELNKGDFVSLADSQGQGSGVFACHRSMPLGLPPKSAIHTMS